MLAAATAAPPPDGLIKDTTTAAFRQDVIAESMNQPVIVDFWAPWCGPCKQLTPVIEKVVRAARGKVKLVKMNIDEHPQVAGQLGVQSIPAVFVFDRGQAFEGFRGALPESQIKAFVEKLVGDVGPGAVDEALAEAAARAEEGDGAGAAELYGAVLAEEPENARAIAGLARTRLDAEDLEGAREILAAAPAKAAADPAIAAVRAAIEIAEQAASLGDTGELEARILADPDDHQARFDLALALNAGQSRGEAADHLLTIVKKDRTWNEDGARKQLVQFFEAWGPADPATLAGRRRLSSILFS